VGRRDAWPDGWGIAQIRQGLAAYRAVVGGVALPHYYALLAGTLGRDGRTGEALASLSTGFAFATKNREQWAVAELFRVQGELLAVEGKAEPARASFRRGIEAAQQTGSLGFEQQLLTLAGRTAKRASTERS
jgi:predicted ATPase